MEELDLTDPMDDGCGVGVVLLEGKKAICTYLNMSEHKVDALLEAGMPAFRVNGTFYSSPEAIRRWFFAMSWETGKRAKTHLTANKARG